MSRIPGDFPSVLVKLAAGEPCLIIGPFLDFELLERSALTSQMRARVHILLSEMSSLMVFFFSRLPAGWWHTQE